MLIIALIIILHEYELLISRNLYKFFYMFCEGLQVQNRIFSQ